jgi:diaminopimelate decarboxylase
LSDTEAFECRDGELACEDVPLSAIADQIGTPFYVYSRARIEANYCRIASAFAPLKARVHYAVKANSNLAVLQLLRDLGAGYDVVSGGELFRVLKVGADPARVAFAGAGKTDAELTYALDSHIGQINAESADELHVLNAQAAERSMKQQVALRLNPGVDPHTHRHISTGHMGSKFGIEMDEAGSLLADAARFPHLDISGLHIHIGSQIPDPGPLVEALDRVLPLIERFEAIRALDIGGGFPVAYREGETVTPPEEFARAVQERLQGFVRPLEISIEPGRCIVADAGALVAQVQATKHSYGRRIVTTDAGMTDLIRPALYDAYHEIVPVAQGQPLDELTDVAGPVCESSDFLGYKRALPAMKRGDLLAVLTAGAYAATMATNYNGHPRAAEVLVEGDTFRVVRRRETWEDLVRAEVAQSEINSFASARRK